MDGIFKRVNIKEEEKESFSQELVNSMEFHELSEYGSLYSLDEFMEDTKCGCLIDYDGNGYLVIDNQEVRNSTSWIFYNSFLIEQKYIITFEELKSLFGDRVKVMWFNK